MDIPHEPPVAVAYADYLTSLEVRYHLPARLLAAIQTVESRGHSNAVSPKGAGGRFQFMSATAARYGINPSNDYEAADGAARYLSDNFQQFQSWPLAIAAYNAGENAVVAYGTIPPYPETQRYVPAVMAAIGQSYTVSLPTASTPDATGRAEATAMVVTFKRLAHVASLAEATRRLNPSSIVRFR